MWYLLIIGFGFAISMPMKDYGVCVANKTTIEQRMEGVTVWCLPDRAPLLQLRSLPE